MVCENRKLIQAADEDRFERDIDRDKRQSAGDQHFSSEALPAKYEGNQLPG
jgi:hypothetical protein